LILHEGLRLKPYHCPAGKLTIGVGKRAERLTGMMEDSAEAIL